MRIWYLSYDRFESRIKKSWDKKGFKPNKGNINILKYSFRTVVYYSNLEKQRVSKRNRFDTSNLKLF
jgi:hypothetical protein